MFTAINGHAEAHSDRGNRLSEAEKDDLFNWIDDGPPDGPAAALPHLEWDGVRLVRAENG